MAPYGICRKPLLGVAVETGLLHGVDGVAQELVGVFLAAETKVTGDFWRREDADCYTAHTG